MAGKGGGAWKVAYADFVTAMMAFFMVMWITSQSKPIKDSIAHYFNDPWGTASRPRGSGSSSYRVPGSRALPTGVRVLRSRNQGGARDGSHPKGGRRPTTEGGRDPSVFVLHDGQVEKAGTVVIFPEGIAELDPAATAQLQDLVPALLGKRNKIEIRGHASRRPLPVGGPFADEWQLCYARCLAAMKYLESQGVEPERIRLSQAGGFEPFSLQVDPDSLAKNSRVEVFVLNEAVDQLQGTHGERADRVAEHTAAESPGP
jgi:chemotaxis protein MotB